MNDITDSGADFISNLADSVRQNPVSAALIGMGVVWLASGGASQKRLGDLFRTTGLDRTPALAKDGFAAARSGLGAGMGSLGDAANSATDAVRESGAAVMDHAARLGSEYSRRVSDSGAAGFDSARERFSELLRTQPLVLGAIGLAIGAGVAAAMPKTAIEDEYLGEASDAIKSKAALLAGEQVDKATALASDVATAASDEARKQGLTVDGVKSMVGDISEKVGRVTNAAGTSAANRTN